VIDQEQVRKYWAGWVRRQIGGNEMVQEAAASAAVNEILLGHNDEAAATAARRMAQSLGVKVKGGQPGAGVAPAATAPSDAPFPGPTSTPGPAPAQAAVAGQPLRCRLCGSVPAANMTIHEHNGRVVWMVHKTVKGPFCRDCGTALLRQRQNSTLFQGWFGIFSFFITPITLLLNLGAWQKVRSLAAPHRDPATESPLPAPLNPGKPLIRRPGPYVGGVVLGAVAVFLIISANDKGGCLDDSTTRANRVTDLHNAYVATYNKAGAAIGTCTTVDCERAPKLEIVSALKTYSTGLSQICWPNDNMKAEANNLIAANGAMVDAFTAWAGATTDADDKTLAAAADQKDKDQQAAEAKLANDLQVSYSSPSP
jgi:hypothetical protein